MSLFNKYRNRVEKSGESLESAIRNQTINMIKRDFYRNPFLEEVLINGEAESVRIVQGETKSNPYTNLTNFQYQFLLPPEKNIALGSIIEFREKKIIIFDRNNHTLSPVIYGLETNTTFEITSVEKVLKGTDSLGRPIYDEQEIAVEYPAFATPKSEFTSFTRFDDVVNAPDGRIYFIIPYTDKKISEGIEFEMFETNYKISSLDYTHVIDGEGVINIMGTKTQK